MAQLIKIGNSQGIRIPKPLIEQAQLEGKQLEFQLVDEGLLIIPLSEARKGWREAIEVVSARGGADEPEKGWLEMPLDADEELEW